MTTSDADKHTPMTKTFWVATEFGKHIQTTIINEKREKYWDRMDFFWRLSDISQNSSPGFWARRRQSQATSDA